MTEGVPSPDGGFAFRGLAQRVEAYHTMDSLETAVRFRLRDLDSAWPRRRATCRASSGVNRAVTRFGNNPGLPGGLLTAQVSNNLVYGQNGNVGAPAGLVVLADGNNAQVREGFSLDVERVTPRRR